MTMHDPMTPHDAWAWIAYDATGATIGEEFSDDGTEHGWAEVDAAAVEVVHLVPLVDGVREHGVHVPAGATPVFFRRRAIVLSPSQGLQALAGTATVAGWERDGAGVYLILDDRGNGLVTTDPVGVLDAMVGGGATPE